MNGFEQIENEIDKLSNGMPVGITVSDVKGVVKQIKCGKSDGRNTLHSDHVVHGTNRLYILLSVLFQNIILHGYVPNPMNTYIIIPIPKDCKGDLSHSGNYRGISLVNCIAKLLDLIVISKCTGRLDTSYMQFAFKQGHSTALCTTVLKEVLGHYTSNGSPVYSCFVNASWAFDKINIFKLFKMLIQRNIPSSILRTLLYCYRHPIIQVKWSKENSREFGALNGVRQGGVLSPLLFIIYMDELLLQLKQKGIRCYIGDYFVGALSYADDLALLCPSLVGLQEMVHVCEEFGVEFDMSYNPKKTKCILFGGLNISQISQQNLC